MNKFPLDGRSKAQKIEDAKQFLNENGYCISGPFVEKTDVKTPAQLVRFFYEQLICYNPDMKISYGGSRKKDLDIAKKFVASRMETGIDKQRAYAECCRLIEFLFKFESSIGLKFKVTSMSVLGQENMAWVTTKLVDAYNGYNDTIAFEEDQRWFDEFYRKQEERDISEEELKTVRKRLRINDAEEK